jgi:hypothetical protein
MDKAKPIIEQYFLNISKATIIKKEVDALKEKAKVEFMGEFSDMKMSTGTSAPLPEAIDKVATDQAKAAITEPEKKEGQDQSSITKGLAGM